MKPEPEEYLIKLSPAQLSTLIAGHALYTIEIITNPARYNALADPAEARGMARPLFESDELIDLAATISIQAAKQREALAS